MTRDVVMVMAVTEPQLSESRMLQACQAEYDHYTDKLSRTGNQWPVLVTAVP